jgi:hypothetical protein
MKRLVFPSPYPPDDDNHEAHQNRLVQSLSSVSKKKELSPMVTSSKGGPRTSTGGGGETKTMDVIDAPENTLRARLIAKMTSLDTNIKRCVSEFLFFLCNENSKLPLSFLSLSVA